MRILFHYFYVALQHRLPTNQPCLSKEDLLSMLFNNKANRVGESQPQKDSPGNVVGSNGLIIKLNRYVKK